MRRDDPFDDIFRELERMMDEMMGDRAGGSDPRAHMDAHIDIHETEDRIRVVADIPGVTEEDIELECDGKTLRLVAAGDQREYQEHVRLPTRIDPTSAETTYNNGVLEVTFSQTDNAADIDID